MEGVPGFDAQYEPPAVKAALPVEWTLGHLFGVWGAGTGEMIPCPLPGHMDDTPSFNLWAPNDDGVPMRFGCFGCGVNGDVIDLIRIREMVGFTEACTIAVDILIPAFRAADWKPADVQMEFRSAATPEQLAIALAELKPDDAHLRAFLDRKQMDVPEHFARAWGWQGAYAGMPVVVFPHRDWDGTLRGVRLRSLRRGNRWTIKGSRFDALYGAWQDSGEESVLLCEGETDTLHAAWNLRDVWIDVLGLATGAAQKPPEEAVARLRTRPRVYLAFDGDMAGRIATTRWKEVLPDALVLPVPEGEDLLSCGIHPRDLIGAVQ